MKPAVKLFIGGQLGFLLLLSLVFLPPLSSEWPGELSHLTITPLTSDTGKRLHVDRGYDFPTGTRPIDMPIWPLHLTLALGMAAFVGAGLAGDRRVVRQRAAAEDMPPGF